MFKFNLKTINIIVMDVCQQRVFIQYSAIMGANSMPSVKRSGRFKNSRKQKLKSNKFKISESILDDEPYHVPDFDYNIDFSQQNFYLQTRKTSKEKYLKQLFKEDNEKFSKKMLSKNKFVSALYDDEDDLSYLKTNKPNVSSNQNEENGAPTLKPLPYKINEENRFEILNDIIMPLHKLPYEKQLAKKLLKNKDILRSFGQKLRVIGAPIRFGRSDLPCTLEPVRPSPLIKHYRNKDEYSVWPGIDGNPKTVGFFVGQPSIHDRVICVEPDNVFISKQSHLNICKKFQNYLRDISTYDVCTNYGLGGHWRRIHIRSNLNNHHMVTAIMHPQNLTQIELNDEMNRLKEYFQDDQSIHSLYFHATKYTRSTHTNEPYYHLFGEQTITEQLFNKYQFAISPSSFFQINTAGSEVLYRVIMTELKLNKKTTVLDLCCGTGTLAILLSDQVKKVIGIDSSKSSIEDAQKNALANGVKNVEFINGTVEEILPKICTEKYLKWPVVAIANPSRGGLHNFAIKTITEMEFIKKLVYVSCKPEGQALKNFVQLCQTKGNNAPFIPINAIPVDLFPQTEHCELVVTFERF